MSFKRWEFWSLEVEGPLIPSVVLATPLRTRHRVQACTR